MIHDYVTSWNVTNAPTSRKEYKLHFKLWKISVQNESRRHALIADGQLQQSTSQKHSNILVWTCFFEATLKIITCLRKALNQDSFNYTLISQYAGSSIVNLSEILRYKTNNNEPVFNVKFLYWCLIKYSLVCDKITQYPKGVRRLEISLYSFS